MVLIGNQRLLAPVEDVLAEGEVSIQEESGEDVADLKHANSPPQQTPDAIERHRVDHIPYRSWCKQCILGRGVGTPHTTVSAESARPILGMDYLFMTKDGLKRRDELAEELNEEGDEAVNEARAAGQLVKCLLVRCFKTKALFAHVIPRKGDDEDH